MRSREYGDVLSGDPRRRPAVPEVAAEPDLVVEEPGSGFCGAVVDLAKDAVTLEDRHGRRRVFPLRPAGFWLDGRPVTLVRPSSAPSTAPAAGPSTGPQTGPSAGPAARRRTASGSLAVPDAPARVARASRIYVEGLHDATLVERVWGDDLRVEGVVVEPLDGIDDLPAVVRGFGPGPGRRLGVLVDHLVAGSKESRIVAGLAHPHVLVTGHPYVDIWQAVKPAAVGIPRWPAVPRGLPWKDGVCQALGVSDTAEMWRRVQRGVRSYADLEVPLLRAVEELIDFVTDPDGAPAPRRDG